MSAAITVGELEIYFNSSTAIYVIFDAHKLILIISSITLIFIPVIRDLYKSKFIRKSNSISPNNVPIGTSVRKQKAEKQLLYETIFICFWKAISVILNILFSGAGISTFYEQLFLLVIDICTFLSNVCALILLLFISSVARRGFKQAFGIEQNKNGASASMAFTVVKKAPVNK